ADALGESAERLATEVRVGTPPPTVRSPSGTPSPPEAAAPVETAPEAAPEAPPPAPPAAAPPAAVEPTGAETAPEAAPEAPPPAPSERAADPVYSAPTPTPAPADAEAPSPEVAATPDPGASDVVRLDRREPPAPEPTAGAADRREADEQLSARLVALQMAVAGGARGEVEAHLRRTFDLEDCTSILDDVFGQGTDGDKRVAWPRPAGGAA